MARKKKQEELKYDGVIRTCSDKEFKDYQEMEQVVIKWCKDQDRSYNRILWERCIELTHGKDQVFTEIDIKKGDEKKKIKTPTNDTNPVAKYKKMCNLKAFRDDKVSEPEPKEVTSELGYDEEEEGFVIPEFAHYPYEERKILENRMQTFIDTYEFNLANDYFAVLMICQLELQIDKLFKRMLKGEPNLSKELKDMNDVLKNKLSEVGFEKKNRGVGADGVTVLTSLISEYDEKGIVREDLEEESVENRKLMDYLVERLLLQAEFEYEDYKKIFEAEAEAILLGDEDKEEEAFFEEGDDIA